MEDHILIVDDDAETRSLLREYLQKQGYRVSAARSALPSAAALTR